MPELPEVETIARQIRTVYQGKRIAGVKAKSSIIFQNISASRFSALLKDQQIQDVQRYGKFLYWKTEKGYPVFHLGMSGIFISERSLSNYPQHIHIEFSFRDGRRLFFQDVRKFSKIYYYREEPAFPGLGIDPTLQKFTLIKFKKLLHLRAIPIKSFLMDQKFIAGVGNIYASEILFDAGISPYKRAADLSSTEALRLYRSIKKILTLAIEHFGTSYTAYRTIEGETGENQNFLRVYQRAGLPCLICGEGIEKSMMNSRSTFYCKKCQVL